MRVLATDLDRTLLPNGHWPRDPDAIDRFNDLTERHDVFVIYVTGRNLDLAEQAIAEYGVRRPHILIGDVGTTIRRSTPDGWLMHEGWEAHVQRSSPRWDRAAIRDAVMDIPGLREQEPEHCGPFKQSYYVEHADHENTLAAVAAQIEGRFDEVTIYSFDSQAEVGLLDFLPNSATKQTALEYVTRELGVNKSDVVFCGDSGNDVFPLTAGFSGVLVRNADAQLVAEVRPAMAANPELPVYFAKGGYQGLNGYYTGGVIEGAHHYGLFGSD